MKSCERFLKYIAFDTKSCEENDQCPSSAGQRVFAEYLVKEMQDIGVENVRIDEHGYVYGSLGASSGREGEPVIGLIAHMDTAPVISGAGVNPRIVNNYQGGDIVLNEDKGIVLRSEEYPELNEYVGQSLVVTDGLTLLGADDKAGIAEILTAVEFIISNNISHPGIRIAFTPDEEIGRGADLFDVEGFGADYAYTVDGGKLGELEYENFNAASAIVKVHGNCIHPGEGKNKMKNSILIAMEFNNMLPSAQIPAHTENYEGFYHLMNFNGTEELTEMSYIIRDHDMGEFIRKKELIAKIAEYINDKYGEATVELDVKDSYYNMKEKILPHMEIIERASKAFRKNNVEPITTPIRGGTDGARLSYMGLLCPNISTGGHNFHGKYEYIPVESMETMVNVIISLVCE